MVFARKLRNRITIQEPTESRDAYGDPVKTWSTYAIRHADVAPISGREFFLSQQVYSEQTTRFKIRYDSVTKNITTKMRIYFKSRYFNIQSVINENTMNRDITLICREVV
jgi:SPP1 family predicted phage head-tail adaptor